MFLYGYHSATLSLAWHLYFLLPLSSSRSDPCYIENQKYRYIMDQVEPFLILILWDIMVEIFKRGI